MIDNADAWQDIPSGPNGGGRSERRVDPKHPLDLFYGRNEFGQYQIILKGSNITKLSLLPIFSGIRLRIDQLHNTRFEFIMELLDVDQLSIFKVLTNDMIKTTMHCALGDSLDGMNRIIIRLKHWQDLLKKTRNTILNRKEIIGLFGELLFLKNYVIPKLEAFNAVSSWTGCNGDEQDFCFGRSVVEIKTQLSTSDRYLYISSENQLDTSSHQIVLCHQTISLSNIEIIHEAMTLNEIVKEIKKIISGKNANALDFFEANLIEAGYSEREEYDAESWLQADLNIYEVMHGFPRIIPNMLPAGVRGVNYQILPISCLSFERDIRWMNEALFG